MRALHRTLELPGANPLKDAHAALGAAVLAACGFSTKKDLLAQLLPMNLPLRLVGTRSTRVSAATNIQDAVDAASDGDEVVVTNGVYAKHLCAPCVPCGEIEPLFIGAFFRMVRVVRS